MPVSAATCCTASSCHFATWYHASAGSSPLRPPKPFVVAKLSISPTLFAGIPIDVKSATACRYVVAQVPVAEDRAGLPRRRGRDVRLADDLRDAAACCHHTAASPPVYGRVATSSTGCAPSGARRWTNVSAFWRYCALLSDQGVTTFAPASSLRTITGVEQPVCWTANVNRLCAFACISDGSAGFVVVPIRLLKLRSK